MALLVQKLWGGKKLSKSVFGYFKTRKNFKKFRRPLSSRGGGGLGLNGPTIKKITFFAASLRGAVKQNY